MEKEENKEIGSTGKSDLVSELRGAVDGAVSFTDTLVLSFNFWTFGLF